MTPMNTGDIKKSAEGILKYINEMCLENRIVFYLAFGTALGAVRHNGFIPWDDDIDIYMTRNEYIKFSDVMKKQSNEQYRLVDIYIDKKYMLPLPKVVDNNTVVEYTNQNNNFNVGVWVDIFVLDNVPENEVERSAFIEQLEKIQAKWYFLQYKRKYDKNNVIGTFKSVVYSTFKTFVSPRIYARKLDILAQKYKDNRSSLVGNMQYSSIRREKTVIPVSLLGKGKKCMFEGNEYNCPERVEDYLCLLYSDYMTLPPIEKRSSKHSTKAYFR